MSAPVRDLVFVSYSHKNAVWLDSLQRLLKPFVRQGRLLVWADPYIEVGSLWQRDIDSALERSKVGVLLLTPDLLASDFVANIEIPRLIQAARAGRLTLVIVPIEAHPAGATRFAEGDLRDFQWPWSDRPIEELEDRLRTGALVRVTEAIVKAADAALSDADTQTDHDRIAPPPLVGPPRRVAIHGLPTFPPNYLRWDRAHDSVKNAILGTAAVVGVSARAASVGLHGEGGLGKTVVAQAIARDADIARAFPDGIYWISVGQYPRLERLQSELAAWAGVPASIESVETGTRALREALRDRSCLVILDDVWQFEHAKAFDVLAGTSRLLVTTRNRSILTALGARDVRLDRLPADLSLELLASWAGVPKTSLPAEAAAVASEVGFLPLALSLAGAHIRDGASWRDLLAELQAGNLIYLDHPYGSVFKTLQATLKALDPVEARRYVELAVFPEDANISVATVALLWQITAGLDGRRSQALITRFASRNLVTVGVVEGGTAGSALALHDLQHDFVRLLVQDLPSLHRAIASSYRAREERWSTVDWRSHEVYPFRHLAKHLRDAGAREDLFALIDKPWMVAHFERELSHRGFLADVEIALAAARTEPTNLVQIFRGCLISATLASSATRVPPEALAALTRLGQVTRALDYVDFMRDPESRQAAYVVIADVLLESGVSHSAKDVAQRALELIPSMSPEARSAALENATRVLAAMPDSELLRRAVSVADTITQAVPRVCALARIAGILTNIGDPAAAETIVTARAVAQSIEDVDSLKELVELSQHCSESHVTEMASRAVLTMRSRAEALEDDVAKVRALSDAADGLAAIHDVASLNEVAHWMVSAVDRFAAFEGNVMSRLLRAMNVRSGAAETSECLELASRTTALTEAIEHHQNSAVDARAQELVRAMTLAEQSWAATALARLFVALTLADCEEDAITIGKRAVAAVNDIRDEATKSTIIAILVSALPKRTNKRFSADLADILLEMIEALEDAQSKVEPLRLVIPILEDAGEQERLRRAIGSAVAVKSAPDLHVEVVETLVETGDTRQALRLIAEMEEGDKSVLFSRAAAALGRAGQYDQALATADLIANPEDAAFAWAVLGDSLAKAGRPDAASRAVDRSFIAADAIRDEWQNFDANLDLHFLETRGREQSKSDSLTVMAEVLARVGNIGAALRILDSVDASAPLKRATALSAVTKALAENGDTRTSNVLALQALAIAEASEPNSGGETDSSTGTRLLQEQSAVASALITELSRPGARAETRGWVAQILGSAGRRSDAIATIDTALSLAESLSAEEQRHALLGVLPALERLEYGEGIRRAQLLAESIADEDTRQRLRDLLELALDHTNEDEPQSFSIQGPAHQKASALSHIAEALAETDLKEEAERAGMGALTMLDDMERVTGDVLIRVVQVFGKVGSVNGLVRAAEMASSLRDTAIKTAVLIAVGRGFATNGDHENAEMYSDLALSILESDERAGAGKSIEMAWIALNLATAGKPERARIVADRCIASAEVISDESEKAGALLEIAARLKEMDYEAGHSQALGAAEALGTVASDETALRTIAQTLAQAGRKEGARHLANQALTTIKTKEEASEQALGFAALSEAFLEADEQRQAVSVATMALMAARHTNRQVLFQVLAHSAAVIAAIDRGETLAGVFEALSDVDSWWA